MTLAEIRATLNEISEEWRSQTATEQKTTLSDLDDLLEELDVLETAESAAAEMVITGTVESSAQVVACGVPVCAGRP